MSEDKQLKLDKRVILGIAEDKLKKDLDKVNKKIDQDNEKRQGLDVFSTSRKQRANMSMKRDNLAFERNEILRRLGLIEEEKKWVII